MAPGKIEDDQCSYHGPQQKLPNLSSSSKGSLETWQYETEQIILQQTAIKAVKVLRLDHVGTDITHTQSAAFISLTGVTSDDGAAVIRAARKALDKARKAAGIPSLPIPKQWHIVTEMPSVTNGSFDEALLRRILSGDVSESAISNLKGNIRRILKTCTSLNANDDKTHTATTRMEEVVKFLWSHVLNIRAESIHSHDTFIRRGGDSITAIELTTTAYECGISIDAATIIQNPRLDAMAAAATLIDREEIVMQNSFSLLSPTMLPELLAAAHQQCEMPDNKVIEDAYPCSPLQEGLMGLAMKQPGSYVTRRSYPLPPTVDIERFKTAWERTVHACANLRTRIILYQGRAIQVVWKDDISWHNLPLSYGTRPAEGLSVHYGSKLCDYAIFQDPVDKTHHFIWVMHHSIFDGWTVRTILSIVYRHYYQPDAPSAVLPPYSNFIKHIQYASNEYAAEYWKAQLVGAKRAIFPPPSALDSRSGSATRHHRSNIVIQNRTDLSITKATLLRIAWAIVLGEYCDTKDVCFGTTVSGRQAPVPGLDRMVGPVVTTVPVRIRLSPTFRISEILSNVQEQAAEMINHEHFGLQNIAKLSIDAKDACDFTSLLLIQPNIELTPQYVNGEQILSLGGLAEEAMASFFNYPLLVQAQLQQDGHIELIMTYDSGVLQHGQVDALSHQFNHVVQQLVLADGADTISTISVAGQWDFQQAITWNNGQRTIQLEGISGLVHELISGRAVRQPDREAVYSSARSLTYGQLDAWSSAFANHLRQNGVTSGTIVPICLEKSGFTIVAMLGVLKAGGAFVPLDPSHPPARRQALIDQIEAQHLIVSASEYENNKKMVPVVLTMCEDFESLSLQDVSSCCGSGLTQESPMYILFTSGSTGRPKAVLVDHVSTTKSLLRQIESFGLDQGTRMLQFAAHTFDVSLLDIFGTLLVGGTVCIPDPDERLYNTASFIQKSGANTANLSPTFAQTLNPEQLPTLKTLILGGEPSTSDLLQRWVGRVRLLNTYGLTESCIWNTIYEFKSAKQSPRTIGRAFNNNCWIVDQHDDQCLAPIGCIGELVLHGPCLAQGYVGDKELTDKVFRRSFGWYSRAMATTEKDWRFLKTGDLARYNPDGEIELIGRKDTQVKLRGRRIELHEIEAAIKSVECDIEYVAVNLIRLRERDHLVAFICFRSQVDARRTANQHKGEEPFGTLEFDKHMRQKVTLLTEHLSNVLPAYMIPSFILPVTSMPLTTSLKLDRKTLKSWVQKLSIDDLGKFVAEESRKLAPITNMEIKLCELWAQILHLAPADIGRTDNFMKIGGDSVSAISLTSLARENGIKLSAAGIFKEPRLCDMALAAVQESRSTAEVKKFSMIGSNELGELMDSLHQRNDLTQHQEVDDIFPCTPVQEGLMALAVKDPGSYLTRRIIRLPDHVSVDKFRMAWESTVRQCGNLRTRIVKQGGETFQVVIKDDMSWQQTTQLDDTEDALKHVQIDYGTRLCFYELIENAADGANYFALSLHHAIYDGWTIRIILDVLQRAYYNTSPFELQPYSAFIQFTKAMDRKEAASYWQDQLKGAKRAAFPADTPVSRTMTEETKTEIRHSKRGFTIPSMKESQFTKATVLRASWAVVLAQYCDTLDICFGATVSGRQGPVVGVEMMAGPTIAAVPVRVKLNKKKTVSSFLMSVQDQASEMVAYEQFGLRNISRLSEEINDACNFTSRLVIQPSTEFGQNNKDTLLPLGSVVDEAMNMLANDPLVVQFGLTDTDTIDLSISYNTMVFSEKEATAISHQLEHVTRQLALQQDGPLDAISVAGPWDMDQVQTWNRELQLDNDGTCVLDLISTTVNLVLNKEAIYSTGRCLSYIEVDRLATKFAYYLGTLGVERGTIIPICFEKSIWAIIAILGIMKAGGVYVPLDAASPIARRKGLVEQVDARMVVASPMQEEACNSLAEKVVVISDGMLSKIPEQKIIANHGLLPSDSAYIFFTSGTTGKPKGIVVHHGALSLAIQAHSSRYGIHENTRLYEFSHYNFDVNVLNIFSTLTEGGTICVPSEEERLYTTPTFMTQARVDFASFAPSFARTVKPESVPSLKTLLVGGEALAKDVQQMWCRHVRLINGYGPTETTISCVAYDVESSEQSPNIIGKPFANDCYVVHPENHNRLMAIGCVGELIIHGHNVAKGYLNNDEMTKEYFLDSVDFLPIDESANPRRFYKTGDLVKYLPDGNIHYLGRKDTQIKIRGKRIEIGEIEATMKAAIADVKHVAVELIRLNTREALVGFVCFDMETMERLQQDAQEESLDEIVPLNSTLRHILLNGINAMKETLPSYMVPSIVIPLRSFPFFASMKLDRKTLKGIVSSLTSTRIAAYNLASKLKVPPSTPLEIKLRDLWAHTLKIKPEEIGKHDSFLQIGGDSISAIELATIAQTEGINLSVANIFQSPQLARLASLVGENSPLLTENTAEETQPFSLISESESAGLIDEIRERCGLTSTSEIEDVYPCTPLQEGLMALAEKCPGSYIGAQVYSLPRHIDVGRFKQSWEKTVEMCSNIRTRIAWLNGRSWQVLLKTQDNWESTDSGTPEDTARNLSKLEMRYGTPLCRYSLIQLDGASYFAIAIHHAIFDGWTVDIIMDTLNRAYCETDAIKLQPYSTFVKYTLSLDTKIAKEYWRKQLDGSATARFPWPRKSDRLGGPTLLTKRKFFISSKETSITKASILRAAWAIVMAQYSMTDDICFGATVSGRLAQVAGIANMAGLTIATVPVRVKINYQQTILSFLQDIQTQSAGMVAYEQFGLQNIAKVSPSARAACDFSSLFLVQPVQKSQGLNDGQIGILELTDVSEQTVLESAESYFNFPLTAQCFLGEDEVEFHLTYQSDLLSEFEMVALSQHFSHVVEQLLAQDDTLLSNVSVSGQWDVDTRLGWGTPETGLAVADCRNYYSQVPVGCVGQLIYFGSNVPAEYPNARELNLVVKPDWVHSSMSSGTTLFATGLLARYLEDGTVTILGKMEQKIPNTTENTNANGNRKRNLAVISAQSTEIEVKLAGLWARVLGLDFGDIAKNDNFLDIGGDSISAIELVALAQKHSINLTVPMVFQNPDLESTATAAAKNLAEVSYQTFPFSLVSSSWNDELASTIISSCDRLVVDDIEDVYPCSALQAGLMALTVTQPGSYINKSSFRLAKGVDRERFIMAWTKTIEACATLRTRIVLNSGEALQVVAKHKPSWETSLLFSGADGIAMGYGLPLCRYGLEKDAQGIAFFTLVMHHSIYDGWTMKLILDTFQKAYRDEAQIQLQPFASFIKYTLSLSNLEATSFWETYLKGAKPSMFPILRSIRNEQASKSTGTLSRKLKLPPTLDSSVTKAVIFRAAWTLLLSRYCETDDVCFGTTVSGRQAPVLGLSYMPGPTIATVPVRVFLQTVKTKSELLQVLQEDSNLTVPFEQFGLQNIAKVRMEAREACDFASLLVIQPGIVDSALSDDPILLPAQSTESNLDQTMQNFFNYPLVAQAFLFENEIDLLFTFDQNAITELQLEAVSNHLDHLLQQLFSKEDIPLCDISLVGSWDMEHAIQSSRLREPTQSCTHWLINEQIRSRPNDPAISAWDGNFTYGELGALALRLAQKLCELGVGPDDPILVCFEKSSWAVVAMLAIQYAGGSIVPLDPAAPIQRLQTIVEDTGSTLALVSPRSFVLLQEMGIQTVIVVEESVSDLQAVVRHIKTEVQPSNTSVVLFTSGTTGRPKGVLLTHESICSSADGYGVEMKIGPGTRVLQFSSYTFDVAILDIFVTLIRGGCICVPSDEERLYGLAGAAKRLNANWAFLTPTVADMLSPEDVPCLKTLCLGGEAVSDHTVQRWKGRGIQIYNGYGPAESSICSWNQDAGNAETSTNIGRPISSAFWVVEQSNEKKLVPIGCVGELLIQGPLLAKGYLNCDRLSSDKWLNNIDWLPKGFPSRGFLTGDLVRRNADGTFDYVGRKDGQIKLHGQRMETAEIEYQILSVCVDAETVVVDVVKFDASEALVAFVVLRPHCHDDVLDGIATKLSAVLPSAMIPKYFIVMDAMPMSMTGKLDRATLCSQASQMTPAELLRHTSNNYNESRPCSTELELGLRSHWSQVLGIHEQSIGAEDNFYHLGGDSIRIVTLAHRILKAYGVTLGLSLINSKKTTIASMAKLIEGQSGSEERSSLSIIDLQKEFTSLINRPWNLRDAVDNSITRLPTNATVFLTGGTGYLGTEILRQLLASELIKTVIVLVRASSDTHGLERVKRTAQIAGWWNTAPTSKISIWTGDLAKPQLGLSQKQLQHLEGTSSNSPIDAIIHNGAVVNWNADYNKLSPANIDSTLYLLHLATSSPVHTKFVYVSGGMKETDTMENELLFSKLESKNGYAQTKILAENVVLNIASRLPDLQNRVSVVKPGLIIGSARHGVANIDDFLWRAAATAVLLGKSPLNDNGWLHVADVEYVSNVITNQIFSPKSTSPSIDMLDGMYMSEFWETIQKELGVQYSPIPFGEWVELALQQVQRVGEEHPLWAAQHFLTQPDEQVKRPTGYITPEGMYDAVRSNVRYLNRIGFLSKSVDELALVKEDVIGRSNMAEYEEQRVEVLNAPLKLENKRRKLNI